MSNELANIFPNLNEVRYTEDGWVSVYDVIRVIGEKKSHREVWKRLTVEYSATVTKCDSRLLRNARGEMRQTPVIHLDNLMELLLILPGKKLDKLREEVSEKITAYYKDRVGFLQAEISKLSEDQKTEVALTTVDEIDEVDNLKRVQKRTEGKITRKHLTAKVSKGRGITGTTYARITNITYKALFGKTAKEFRQETGKAPRESMDIHQLSDLQFMESLLARRIDTTGATTSSEMIKIAKEVGADVAAILKKYQ